MPEYSRGVEFEMSILCSCAMYLTASVEIE